MATYSVAEGKHATLVAATVDTVTLTGNNANYIQVTNRGTSGDIYFTTDGGTPTSTGDNTHFVGPGQSLTVFSGNSDDIVKLISAGTPAYSVEAAQGADGFQRTSGASSSAGGSSYSSNETSTLNNGATALTPKFASIAVSSSGDNSVVALVSSKKLRVLDYTLIANGAVNAKFRSNTTDKTGLLYCVANSGVSCGYSPLGHFETAAGEALQINLSGAVAVGGHLTYVEV